MVSRIGPRALLTDRLGRHGRHLPVISLILLLSDYYGYAGVLLAIALAAAINLR